MYAVFKCLCYKALNGCSFSFVPEGRTETNDSRPSAESTLKDDELFAGIPAEKAMQFAIILADINSKYAGQAFNPS